MKLINKYKSDFRFALQLLVLTAIALIATLFV